MLKHFQRTLTRFQRISDIDYNHKKMINVFSESKIKTIESFCFQLCYFATHFAYIWRNYQKGEDWHILEKEAVILSGIG